jgi:Bacterial regulatory proteins, luxR family
VLATVASGKRSRAVASELGVTEATVKTHLYSVYRKLGVSNRVGGDGVVYPRPRADRASAWVTPPPGYARV